MIKLSRLQGVQSGLIEPHQTCPFESILEVWEKETDSHKEMHDKLCGRMFKKTHQLITEEYRNDFCPCFLYSMQYVIRRAKEFIKE
jgi:hypothetical protein